MIVATSSGATVAMRVACRAGSAGIALERGAAARRQRLESDDRRSGLRGGRTGLDHDD